jgi:hypothetical protein
MFIISESVHTLHPYISQDGIVGTGDEENISI